MTERLVSRSVFGSAILALLTLATAPNALGAPVTTPRPQPVATAVRQTTVPVTSLAPADLKVLPARPGAPLYLGRRFPILASLPRPLEPSLLIQTRATDAPARRSRSR